MTDKTSKPVDLIGQMVRMTYGCDSCGMEWSHTWNAPEDQACPKCGAVNPPATVEDIAAEVREQLHIIVDRMCTALMFTYECTGDITDRSAILKLLTTLRKYSAEARKKSLPESSVSEVPQPAGTIAEMEEDDIHALAERADTMLGMVVRAIAAKDERLALVGCSANGSPTFALSFVDELEDGTAKVTPMFVAVTEGMEVVGPEGESEVPGNRQLH